MHLADYTTSGGFLPRLASGSVTEAVDSLVASLAADGDVDDGELLARDVMEREADGSTAVGGGLIIPHARSRHARRLRIAIATLAEPLPIPTDDGRPVDVVVLLVGPTGEARLMLRLLARLARLVKQREFLDSLRSADSPAALQRAFALAGGTSN